MSIQSIQGILTVKCLRSFWIIRCISDFRQTLYLENGRLERNIHLNLYVILFCVVIVCHLVKLIVKAPGLLVFFYLCPVFLSSYLCPVSFFCCLLDCLFPSFFLSVFLSFFLRSFVFLSPFCLSFSFLISLVPSIRSFVPFFLPPFLSPFLLFLPSFLPSFPHPSF